MPNIKLFLGFKIVGFSILLLVVTYVSFHFGQHVYGSQYQHRTFFTTVYDVIIITLPSLILCSLIGYFLFIYQPAYRAAKQAGSKICSSCQGTGKFEESHPEKTCMDCNGDGIIQGGPCIGSWGCQECSGTGKQPASISTWECKTCSGHGKIFQHGHFIFPDLNSSNKE